MQERGARDGEVPKLSVEAAIPQLWGSEEEPRSRLIISVHSRFQVRSFHVSLDL